jgi:thiamine phosphate synthase YjbQ (UPF0047 family)
MHSLKAYINATGGAKAYVLTHDVKRALSDAKAAAGLVNVLSTQGTTSILLLENDESVRAAYLDFAKKTFEHLPENKISRKTMTGADRYHLMATLSGLSLTVPFQAGRLLIHPQHEILAMDFEPKAGRREFIITVLPEVQPQAREQQGPRMEE